MAHARFLRLFAIAAALLAVTPAQAGLFELLFGSSTRPAPPAGGFSPMPAPGDPALPPANAGGGRVFCMRACDGFYFPVEGAARGAAESLCAASCPNQEMAVFRGPALAPEAAVDARGRRYGDLPNAFAYRTGLREGCSCRRDEGYVAAMQRILSDPTLRRGDLVVTLQGASVFSPANPSRSAWTSADFLDVRRPGALPAGLLRQAERMLGPGFDTAARRPEEPARVAGRRANEIVVTPTPASLRRLEPRQVGEPAFGQ
ncbi:DUF2865 domain-containing protein [Alsobacter sp. R-9]